MKLYFKATLLDTNVVRHICRLLYVEDLEVLVLALNSINNLLKSPARSRVYVEVLKYGGNRHLVNA